MKLVSVEFAPGYDGHWGHLVDSFDLEDVRLGEYRDLAAIRKAVDAVVKANCDSRAYVQVRAEIDGRGGLRSVLL